MFVFSSVTQNPEVAWALGTRQRYVFLAAVLISLAASMWRLPSWPQGGRSTSTITTVFQAGLGRLIGLPSFAQGETEAWRL